jgi:hypothetical protein
MNLDALLSHDSNSCDLFKKNTFNIIICFFQRGLLMYIVVVHLYA